MCRGGKSSYGLKEILWPVVVAVMVDEGVDWLEDEQRLSEDAFSFAALSDDTLLDRLSPASLLLLLLLLFDRMPFLPLSKANIGLPAPRMSAPIFEQVIARRAKGLFFASCRQVNESKKNNSTVNDLLSGEREREREREKEEKRQTDREEEESTHLQLWAFHLAAGTGSPFSRWPVNSGE